MKPVETFIVEYSRKSLINLLWRPLKMSHHSTSSIASSKHRIESIVLWMHTTMIGHCMVKRILNLNGLVLTERVRITKCAKVDCTILLLTGMLVMDRIRTIKVYIVSLCEATMFVVWFWIDSLPCVVHELFDILFRYRTMFSNFLLPIVEDRIVEWGKTLRSIRWHEYNLDDRLWTTIMECLEDGISVKMNWSTIDHESDWITIESLYTLSEYTVDKFLKHLSINSSYSYIASLTWWINLGYENSIASSTCDHVVTRSIRWSIGG